MKLESPSAALAWFATRAPSNIKMGLERVQRALAELGNPERRFRAIQVAGTNGKGSTSAFLASCLRQKFRTGLYTSPHLVRPNERIVIDGVEISDLAFGQRLQEVAERVSDAESLTYFELGTLVAFAHFDGEKVDIAVLETGLGGRLDATTACSPEVTVITPISFDHQEYLGHTLAAIAGEKAGIIKPGVPVVCAAQPPEALEVIERVAREKNARLSLEGRDFQALHGVSLPLKGPHQAQNAAVALAALRTFGLTEQQLRRGLETTRWPGRFERFAGAPPIILDGAHNPGGVEALIAALSTECPGAHVELVFGVFADKDFEPMIRRLFPAVAGVHLTPVPSPRSKPPESYLALAQQLNPRTRAHAEVWAALDTAKRQAGPTGVVVVAGSLSLVGQVRATLAR